MRVSCNSKGRIEVEISEEDLCITCKANTKCPLLSALQKEFVLLRYEEIGIECCDMFENQGSDPIEN